MAMFCDVNDYGFLPTEQEVADCCAEYHRDAQPNVIRHKDQHQEIRQHDLDDVEKCLERMHPR